MGTRPLYVLTLVLLVIATCTGIAAQRASAQAVKSAAQAVSAERDVDRQALRDESRFYLRQHARIAAVTLVVFVVGIGSWVCSRQRKEPGRQGIPFVLAVSAAIVQSLLV